MMSVAISAEPQLAAIMSSAVYSVWFLLAGFFIPYAQMAPWWAWSYWCVRAWWTRRWCHSLRSAWQRRAHRATARALCAPCTQRNTFPPL
jgi:hypothetical protein